MCPSWSVLVSAFYLQPVVETKAFTGGASWAAFPLDSILRLHFSPLSPSQHILDMNTHRMMASLQSRLAVGTLGSQPLARSHTTSTRPVLSSSAARSDDDGFSMSSPPHLTRTKTCWTFKWNTRPHSEHRDCEAQTSFHIQTMSFSSIITSAIVDIIQHAVKSSAVCIGDRRGTIWQGAVYSNESKSTLFTWLDDVRYMKTCSDGISCCQVLTEDVYIS